METIIKQKNKSRKFTKHTIQLFKLKRKFIEYYAKLPIQKLAAEFIGKSEDWVIDWKKGDTKFANQIASARSAWALDNAGKVKRKEWLLERVMHDHFKERTLEEHDVSDDVKRIMEFMRTILPKQK